MDLTKEYESLREEIFEWQRRRITILSLTIIFITTYLTYLQSSSHTISKLIAISIPFIFISSAVFITSLFGRFITMIGTYLEVYHSEFCWNMRVTKFKKRFWFLELNYGLAIIYFAIGILTGIIILSSDSYKGNTCCDWIIFIFTAILFLSSFITTFFYPRNNYHQEWLNIQKEEKI